MDEVKSKVVDLDLNDILPNRFQPRIKFSEDSIIELSDSIKVHGVIQPIIVRPIGDKYEIIAGERRYKASVLAGKDTIPAIITSLNDKDSAEVALIENVQRKDLSPIEEAISYKKILDIGYLTQEQLATKLGKSQSAIANKIRLLNLCDEVQEALMEEKISERHARALLKVHGSDKQKEMLSRIISERLTVRRTEEEIEKMNKYITEAINEVGQSPSANSGLNNNPNGMDNGISGELLENKSVDFNSLLMNQTSVNANDTIFNQNKVISQMPPFMDSSVGTNDMAEREKEILSPSFSTSEYQFNTDGLVVGDGSFKETTTGPSLGATGYQFDANGVVVSDGSTKETTTEPSVGAIGYPFNVNGAEVNDGSPKEITTEPSLGATGYQFDANGVVVNDGNTLVPPEPAYQFDANGIVITDNRQPEDIKLSFDDLLATSSEREAIHKTEPSIPQTPIEENVIQNTFVPTLEESISKPTDSNSVERSMATSEETSMNEKKEDIQPIIITDYTKQYDPVLPTPQKKVEKIDFKQIIGLIRDVSDTIEKCGYTIDSEEYDLENEYRVVFTINKN